MDQGTALGLANAANIPDAAFIASSVLATAGAVTQHASFSRLNRGPSGGPAQAWCPLNANANEWLQVDLGAVYPLSYVATQGRGDVAQWVLTYRISYSTDNATFTYLAPTFPGNIDQNTVEKNPVDPPVDARYVRIHPQTWSTHPSLRWELFAASFYPQKWLADPKLQFTGDNLAFLKQYVERFEIPGLSKINIAVCGGVGVGKSSFHLSVVLARTGELHQHTLVRDGAVDSVTLGLTKFPFDPLLPAIPLCLWDLPGYKTGATYQADELSQILRGHWKNGYIPTFPAAGQQDKFVAVPTLDQKALCVLMLVKATQRDAVTYINETKRHIQAAESLGIPVIIGVTHVDKLDPSPKITQDPGKALFSIKVHETIQGLSRQLGLPSAQLIPFVNEWSNETLEPLNRDVLIYYVLYRCLLAVKSSLYRPDFAALLEQHRASAAGRSK